MTTRFLSQGLFVSFLVKVTLLLQQALLWIGSIPTCTGQKVSTNKSGFPSWMAVTKRYSLIQCLFHLASWWIRSGGRPKHILWEKIEIASDKGSSSHGRGEEKETRSLTLNEHTY